MNRGQFPDLVLFKRAATTTNDYGEEIAGTPATIAEAFARIRYGAASEKRQAAQEQSGQTATFEFMPNSELLAVEPTDFMDFDGSHWDLHGPPEKLDRNLMRFTATRSV